MEKKELYRVLIVHNYYQIPGGEDTVVSNEKRLLEEHGHAVFFYMRENQEINNFSLFRKLLIPFTTIFSWKTYREVRSLIEQEHIDVVHVHNTLSLISPSVYYAASHCGVPVVQTIHNFRLLCPAATFVREGQICEECIEHGLFCAVKGKCYRNSCLQTLVSALTLKIHRMLGTYRKLNYICLSEFNKKKLLQLNVNGVNVITPEHVYIKPNFVKENYLDDIEDNWERKEQYLFVGRLDFLKGIRILIQAWEGVQEGELIICGTGPEEKWLRVYMEQHSIKNVRILGQVGHEEIFTLLKQSKALIMPTQWYEGQPMVILESYYVGTPVIGSRVGNVREMIEDGVTGITFTMDSPEELRQAILTLPQFDRKEIRHHFAERYGQKKNYEMLMKIYSYAKEDAENERNRWIY